MCGIIEIIKENFLNIKQNFQIGLLRYGYEFDEDLFVDVVLKCIKTLENKDLSKQEFSKYIWVAYLNKVKRIKSKKIFINSLDDFIEVDENLYIIDEEYNENTDNLYNEIVKEIKNKFGESVTNAWILHICHNKSYKELANDFRDMKFNFEFKRIKKYILNKLVKTNKNILELMSNMYE